MTSDQENPKSRPLSSKAAEELGDTLGLGNDGLGNSLGLGAQDHKEPLTGINDKSIETLSRNQYSGFIPNRGWKVERKSCIDPLDLNSNYISTRTPVIIDKKFVPDYDAFLVELSKVDCQVEVELESNGEFGTEKREQMNFQDFLVQVDNGGLYLTTQYHEQGSLLKQFMQPPLDQLLHLVPLKQDLIQELVVNQINMWVGYSNGQSSRLHFDYHDNLYFCVQGCKEFTIFPPSDYKYLYLNSELQVHENGLFYSPDSQVRSDGAFCSDVGQYKMELAEKMLETAESDEQVEYAEKMMDEAMIMLAGGDETLKEYESGDEDESSGDEHSQGQCDASNIIESEYSEDESINSNGKRLHELKDSGAKFAKMEPQSFSSIPTQVLRNPSQVSESQFPLFKHANPINFTLKPGECLYLPCGWFHEVTSNGGRHLAVNYWCAPPNKNGYQDNYWKDCWERQVLDEIATITNKEE